MTKTILALGAVALLSPIFCQAASAATNIKIDADATREPISKFIYGQFIEHLGHCIYGGLWAEMLQDRKFYYPVTDQFDPWGYATDKQWQTGPYPFLKASPWRIAGDAKSVSTDTQRPYSGEHAVACAGAIVGISQDGLSIIADKRYTGRIVLGGKGSVMIALSVSGKLVAQKRIDIAGDDYRSYDFELSSNVTSDQAVFSIVGNGDFRIGCVSLMPVDNVKGWRPEVVALLKELDSPVYRWPGGNFVSGYDWHDGLGDRDKRPPRKNPAWKGVESNDVGIHEFVELMRMIDSEPFIALNTGVGTAEQAAAEVEYLNGSADTNNGKLRAANGHPESFNVKFFAVGNEMYGSWQIGHIPLEQYVQKHNTTADAIWKIDPKAQLVGVGSTGTWDEAMLKVCADHMNLLSEHIYVKELTDVRAHSGQLAKEIKRVADAHRKYRAEIDAIKNKPVPIAMDEWNYWYGDYRYGELACRYYLKDGLGVARGLHEYFRNSDIYFMANYAQTVNVLGCIKANQTKAAMETTGLVLAMYRKHFGTIPVNVTIDNPDLDVSAAWTADKSALTVAVVNPTMIPQTAGIDAGKLSFKPSATSWQISSADPEDYNSPEKGQVIDIQQVAQDLTTGLVIPPYSVVVTRLEK